jgi:hypothetical protein
MPFWSLFIPKYQKIPPKMSTQKTGKTRGKNSVFCILFTDLKQQDGIRIMFLSKLNVVHSI